MILDLMVIQISDLLNLPIQVDDADSEPMGVLTEDSSLSATVDTEFELSSFLGEASSSSGMFIDTQAGPPPVTTANIALQAKSTATSTLLNKDSMNITEKKSIDDDNEWIKYAGQLEVITNLNKDLIDTLKNKHKIPNIIEFLTSVTTSCEEIQSLSKDLGSKSQILIDQLLENVESRDDYIPDIFNTDYKVPHDPGCRPKTLTREQRMYLIKLGQCQPILPSYPKNDAMKAQKGTYCFSPRWYKEYPYIEYSIDTDKAYCFVCKLFSFGNNREKSEEVWIEGFCNWQKAKGSQGK